ncbi:MAG: phage protein GemA/Gp16 family protein [Phycisphaerae bacterium]|nr:phage protein GemA/Gp16 family protein [Phycisphaerae bacterium]
MKMTPQQNRYLHWLFARTKQDHAAIRAASGKPSLKDLSKEEAQRWIDQILHDNPHLAQPQRKRSRRQPPGPGVVRYASKRQRAAIAAMTAELASFNWSAADVQTWLKEKFQVSNLDWISSRTAHDIIGGMNRMLIALRRRAAKAAEASS